MLVVRGKKKSPAQFLQAVTGISSSYAYKATKDGHADEVGIEALWDIYAGLKDHGVTVIEKGKERPLIFDFDVYEELEA